MARAVLRLGFLGIAAAPGIAACGEEQPPAPPVSAPQAAAAPQAPPVYDPSRPAVLTYPAERGRFADTSDPSKVPEAVRGLVRVTLLDGPAPPPGTVWVTNLRTPLPSGGYALTTVPREMFEELALGQGMSSRVQLPEGLELPEALPSDGVVVYKTSWCGVCKKLEAYLKRKGVAYTAKDIEADPKAAAELAAKLAKVGAKGGSVPVIDVRGTIIVGFNRARLEALLDGTAEGAAPASRGGAPSAASGGPGAGSRQPLAEPGGGREDEQG